MIAEKYEEAHQLKFIKHLSQVVLLFVNEEVRKEGQEDRKKGCEGEGKGEGEVKGLKSSCMRLLSILEE